MLVAAALDNSLDEKLTREISRQLSRDRRRRLSERLLRRRDGGRDLERADERRRLAQRGLALVLPVRVEVVDCGLREESYRPLRLPQGVVPFSRALQRLREAQRTGFKQESSSAAPLAQLAPAPAAHRLPPEAIEEMEPLQAICDGGQAICDGGLAAVSGLAAVASSTCDECVGAVAGLAKGDLAAVTNLGASGFGAVASLAKGVSKTCDDAVAAASKTCDSSLAAVAGERV